MKKTTNVRASNKRMRKRQQVLDVSLRRGTERARRVKAVCSITFKVLLIGGLLIGAIVGGREALRRFIWENPDYLIGEVAYHTDGTLTRAHVIEVSGIQRGDNIFKVDIGKAREAINSLPQVDRVEVQRLLPNRVTISISERKPIAWVAKSGSKDPTTSGEAFLIDARGIAMKPRSILHQYMHLPIISGFPVENLADGQRVTSYEVVAALELIRLNTDNTRWQIKTVDVANGYSLMVTDNRRIQLVFDLENFERQLAKLQRLFDIIGDKESELQTVNLFGERNTYVTYAPPAEPPPEAAPVVAGPAKPGSKGATPAPAATPSPKRKPEPTPAARPTSRGASPSIESLRQPFRTNGTR